jgi:hypothetical protein
MHSAERRRARTRRAPADRSRDPRGRNIGYRNSSPDRRKSSRMAAARNFPRRRSSLLRCTRSRNPRNETGRWRDSRTSRHSTAARDRRQGCTHPNRPFRPVHSSHRYRNRHYRPVRYHPVLQRPRLRLPHPSYPRKRRCPRSRRRTPRFAHNSKETGMPQLRVLPNARTPRSKFVTRVASRKIALSSLWLLRPRSALRSLFFQLLL